MHAYAYKYARPARCEARVHNQLQAPEDYLAMPERDPLLRCLGQMT